MGTILRISNFPENISSILDSSLRVCNTLSDFWSIFNGPGDIISGTNDRSRIEDMFCLRPERCEKGACARRSLTVERWGKNLFDTASRMTYFEWITVATSGKNYGNKI